MNLKLLYTNIRSLNNKVSELNFVMQETMTELVALSESWLTDDMLDCMIVPSDWSMFRRDRGSLTPSAKHKGGGVCIMCKNNPMIFFKSVNLPARFDKLEIVAIDILLDKNKGTRLIVAYYPPDLLNDIYMCQLLISAFMYIGNTEFYQFAL